MTTCDKNYIEQKIIEALNPSFLEIIDESKAHANHYENIHKSISHVKIKISSKKFSEKTKIACHQMIYKALNDEIRSGAIHAIKIEIINTIY